MLGAFGCRAHPHVTHAFSIILPTPHSRVCGSGVESGPGVGRTSRVQGLGLGAILHSMSTGTPYAGVLQDCGFLLFWILVVGITWSTVFDVGTLNWEKCPSCGVHLWMDGSMFEASSMPLDALLCMLHS